MHGRALKDYGDFALMTGGDQLDFFDSVGIMIWIRPEFKWNGDVIFYCIINGTTLKYFETRKQATKEAIKYAAVMYNEKFK